MGTQHSIIIRRAIQASKGWSRGSYSFVTTDGHDVVSRWSTGSPAFIPKKNTDFKAFQFQQAAQQEGETINQLVTCLHKLTAVSCEFPNLDSELKAAVIENLTLKKLLSKAKSKPSNCETATCTLSWHM